MVIRKRMKINWWRGYDRKECRKVSLNANEKASWREFIGVCIRGNDAISHNALTRLAVGLDIARAPRVPFLCKVNDTFAPQDIVLAASRSSQH